MLIALTGPEGGGKSLSASILASRLNLPLLPFAGPLKAMLAAMGVERRHLYGRPEEKAQPLDLLGGKSARQAMQTLGTEWGRTLVDKELWLRAWAATLTDRGGIVDDARFPNEVALIKSKGGHIIQVMRRLEDLQRVPAHPSEDFASLPYDVRIVNDRCPAVLERKLVKACQAFSQ